MAASAVVMMIATVDAGYAAALGTGATTGAAGPSSCIDIQSFFLSGCQLSWYGVRFYGTVDIGYGYETHGTAFSKQYADGVSYMISKSNGRAMWELSPNGLSQSNVGIQIKEPLASGWWFIGQLEAAFDPYSLELANNQKTLVNNVGVPLSQQTANGDATIAGQFYSNLGYAGISSDTYGTLTVFRQVSLLAEGVRSYDPMGAPYAFSPIGFSGQIPGGGIGEDAKFSTSAKYHWSHGGFRLGAQVQFGGYDLNNGSKGAYQGELGSDIHVGPGVVSLDAIGSYAKDAVTMIIGGAPQVQAPLTAVLSDNTSVMALAKYTVDKLKLYAGYNWIQYAPPSDPITSGGFNDLEGDYICANCTTINNTTISNTSYSGSYKDKVLQVVWAGARYSVSDSLDVAGAYYHYDQNNYNANSANIQSCVANSTSNPACRGTLDAVSALIDWKFAPKWDTYIGTMFSQTNGGLNSGYLARNDLATTAGVRFRW